MFIVTHAAIGALIAEMMPAHPVAVFVCSVVAHFFTDMIPHGDTHLYNGYITRTGRMRAFLFIGIDSLLTVIFIASIFLMDVFDALHRSTIIIGVIAGILPDLLAGLYELFRIKLLRSYHAFHLSMHNVINSRTGDLSLEGGTMMELILLTIIVFRVT
jgi:hypothetical protein